MASSGAGSSGASRQPFFGLKANDILIPRSPSSKSFSLGPQSFEPPLDLISAEMQRIPFMAQTPNPNIWTNQLRAWPFPMEGWVNWYKRVSKDHAATWQAIGIADALYLTISPIEKHENLLRSIGYFWSDTLNCFMFGCGPMTQTLTLMDVVMILGLDIHSTCPSPFSLAECSHRIVDKAASRNWGQYINHHQKSKGFVDHREHIVFLNLWLDHFLFCGSSLAPTKNYLNLANALADGNRLALGKLFLGVLYRHLSLNNSRLLSGDRIRAGGP